MGFKDKLNQILYAFSTEDRYAEYDENNHHTRTAAQTARGDGIQLNDAGSFQDDDAAPGAVHSTEGVSETILAWRHIETWTSENHADLNATLADPCTRADISKAEQDLGIEFPAPLRASLRIHDGQEDLESLTGSGGLIFGLPLMDLSQIVEMTETWRVVANKMISEERARAQKASSKGLISPVGSSADINQSNVSLVETKPGFSKVETDEHTVDPDLERKISTSHSKKFKSHIPKQQSFPPGFIQPVYAHPNWIPLLTDHSGNHIGVDLAPGPKGKVGQVIIFGRDFDTKFYLAPTWGDFLLSFVKDLEEGNYTIDEGKFEDMYSGEGELLFFDKKTRRDLPYLRVLTTRVFQKYPEYLPKRPQPTQHQPPKSQNVNTTATTTQKVVPKKTAESERIASQDITNNKNKENEPEPEHEVSLIDDDEITATAADKSQDITDKVANDFKEVSI